MSIEDLARKETGMKKRMDVEELIRTWQEEYFRNYKFGDTKLERCKEIGEGVFAVPDHAYMALHGDAKSVYIEGTCDYDSAHRIVSVIAKLPDSNPALAYELLTVHADVGNIIFPESAVGDVPRMTKELYRRVFKLLSPEEVSALKLGCISISSRPVNDVQSFCAELATKDQFDPILMHMRQYEPRAYSIHQDLVQKVRDQFLPEGREND